ncbi:hypothetical protein [Amycolatopsis australiensis]|uniref:Uncharacterized protein n=1 Tax=Amycolatopsis australiensis TaxID=546364 RepID=A0A1K1QZA7_9PSEU|nr:hypothetical protein [Amycolatopsis australiensis]SFW64939.1 hypothetical protein SAMN04489730_2401 [Amycolatopsis australiensis]
MHTGDWPATAEDARAGQERLRGRVDLSGDVPELPPAVTRLDAEHEDDVRALAPETRSRVGCARAGFTNAAGRSGAPSVDPAGHVEAGSRPGHRATAHAGCRAQRHHLPETTRLSAAALR